MASNSSNVAIAAERVAAKLAEADDASLQPLAVAGAGQDAFAGPMETRKEEAVPLIAASLGVTSASSNGTSDGGVHREGGPDKPFGSAFPAATAAAGTQQAAVPGELREAIAAAQQAVGGLGAAGAAGGEAGGAGAGREEEEAVGEKGPLLAGRVPDAYGGADPAAHCIDASELVARAEPQ